MVKKLLGALLLCVCSAIVVADEELPEIEFLEYLGLWEDSDEDWVMFSDPISADANSIPGDQPRREPAPEGEESMEKPDES